MLFNPMVDVNKLVLDQCYSQHQLREGRTAPRTSAVHGYLLKIQVL